MGNKPDSGKRGSTKVSGRNSTSGSDKSPPRPDSSKTFSPNNPFNPPNDILTEQTPSITPITPTPVLPSITPKRNSSSSTGDPSTASTDSFTKIPDKKSIPVGPRIAPVPPKIEPKKEPPKQAPPPQPSGSFCPVCDASLNNMTQGQIANHVENCLGEAGKDSWSGEAIKDTDPEMDPFALVCPYPNCGLQFEACDFPNHARLAHKNGPQNFGCPICTLLGNPPFVPNEKTNLLAHLNHSHPDFVPKSPTPQAISIPSVDTKTRALSISKSPTPLPPISSEYIVSAYSGTTTPECSICYEEILTGEQTARLACFCLFHNHCAQAWFKKKGKTECPFHMQREESK